MGYVAVKGGTEAIAATEGLLGLPPDGATAAPIEVEQVRARQRAFVDQVMGEGGLYAPALAALAIVQAEGDVAEASFLLRAHRSTLPRLGYTLPVDTEQMQVRRRISSAFKEVPGGQVLGRTRDYTQRLLDFAPLRRRRFAGDHGRDGVRLQQSAGDGQARNGVTPVTDDGHGAILAEPPIFPRVSAWLRDEGLLPPLPAAPPEAEPFDLTRASLRPPVPRSARLQALARGETGAMVAFAYTLQRRGWGHPVISDLRVGEVPFRVVHPLTGNPVTIGAVTCTEVETTTALDTHARMDDRGGQARFGLAYGLVFGQHERKAIAMSLLDGALSDAHGTSPAHDPEFVLYHIDGIESQGMVEHLKLPHHVSFQSQLDRKRHLQQMFAATAGSGR